MNITFVRGVSR